MNTDDKHPGLPPEEKLRVDLYAFMGAGTCRASQA